MAIAQGERINAYQVRASLPNATGPSVWSTIWDINYGIYGADLPIASLRLSNRLSQPSECEFEMPRTDYRNLVVQLGNFYDNASSTLAPMMTIISVYRFGVAIFSGPIWSIRGATDRDNITVQCKDFTSLFEKALITPTYATSSADIFSILVALHNQWYGRSISNGYAALQHVFDVRRYTSPGSSYNATTLGKSVAFRIQQYENVMLADAMSQLSMIGGDTFQYQWWCEYVTTAVNPPQCRVIVVSPYAYYYLNTADDGYRLEAGEGTRRTVNSCDWTLDGAGMANEYVVAGYGQGSSQQRASYAGTGSGAPLYRAPLQAFIESDQSVRRNDHAVARAKAGWQRTSNPGLTLRMTWTALEWDGKLPYNVVRPGARVEPIVTDSFLSQLLQANKSLECSAWSLEVSSGEEICSADFFVPNY